MRELTAGYMTYYNKEETRSDRENIRNRRAEYCGMWKMQQQEIQENGKEAME